jgi:hypothetical protein
VVTRARCLLAAGREERVVAYRLDLAVYVHQRCRCVFGTRGVLGQRHRGRVLLHRFSTFVGSSTPALAPAVTNAVCDLMVKAGFALPSAPWMISWGSRQRHVWRVSVAYLRSLLAWCGLVENVR